MTLGLNGQDWDGAWFVGTGDFDDDVAVRAGVAGRVAFVGNVSGDRVGGDLSDRDSWQQVRVR